jgi:hypothetical protein
MSTLTFTGSQHRLLLPEEIKERAIPLIQTQATTTFRNADHAPFHRMIDFWFTAIAWAVHHGVEPVQQPTGKFFVALGPNTQDIRHFEEWRADLLAILAVRDFGAHSPDVMDTRKVIDLANRYAEAGAPLLLEHLKENTDLSLPRLYLVADIFSEIVTQAADQRSDRTF